ncbi:MAG: glutathione S-transferase family protein [Myxococcales bacterium]|nr:glutathione S-transferase family protein [Myxococcales bacterium]
MPHREPPKIILYIQPGFELPGHPRCLSGTPFAIKVARTLAYKGLDFELEEVGWAERAERLPQISAARKLPVLEYNGERIEDSTDIAYFLDARHPSPPLLPADPELRARCHFVEDWADEVLYWYGIYEQRRISPSSEGSEAYFADFPEPLRQAAAQRLGEEVEKNLDRQGVGRYPVDKVKADTRRGLDALVTYLENAPYIAGPALSLADLAVFGQFRRRLAGTNPWLEGEIRARPTLGTWYERVDAATRR